MNQEMLRHILRGVKNGAVTIDQAAKCLQPYDDLSFAKVDYSRGLVQGFGEVIYGQGKTEEQVVAIARSLKEAGEQNILVTRICPECAVRLSEELGASLYEQARIAVVNPMPVSQVGNVLLMCAGTSDLPVAEEAAVTAETMGAAVTRLYDVGVAGLHRLLSNVELLQGANVIICVAGMEGALPSVVAGLTDRPVIAVPTSVGYGASFGGLAALLAMLNSCGSGVTVVNIDNGFGAGYTAALINRRCIKE